MANTFCFIEEGLLCDPDILANKIAAAFKQKFLKEVFLATFQNVSL